jgi:cell division control protein 6
MVEDESTNEHEWGRSPSYRDPAGDRREALSDGSSATTTPISMSNSNSDNTVSEGLFEEFIHSAPIFETKDVLRPSYTPHELPHRSDQINQMATILASALKGETPSNVLIYGKTGTGKTASAKYVSQELEDTSSRYDVPCQVVYINCEVTDTKYRVLAKLANTFIRDNQTTINNRIRELEELRSKISTQQVSLAESEFASPDEIDTELSELNTELESLEEVPMTGWPTDRVYDAFFDAVDRRERVTIIMQDDISKLVKKGGDNALYNL